MKAMNGHTLADTIRAAEVCYAEPIASVLVTELRAWNEFGYRLGVSTAWRQMSALVTEIHRHELALKEAADERAREAAGG